MTTNSQLGSLLLSNLVQDMLGTEKHVENPTEVAYEGSRRSIFVKNGRGYNVMEVSVVSKLAPN